MINFTDLQRQQTRRNIQSVKTIGELNRSYTNRSDAINGWQGSAGQLNLMYSSLQGYATFGNNNTSDTVGP